MLTELVGVKLINSEKPPMKINQHGIYNPDKKCAPCRNRENIGIPLKIKLRFILSDSWKVRS